MRSHGGQTALTKEEEEHVILNLNTCAEWGYPLDVTDFSFLKRNKKHISQRLCQNIKRARATVSPTTINEFLSELVKSIENVPLGNILNYDESNLFDDPGRHSFDEPLDVAFFRPLKIAWHQLLSKWKMTDGRSLSFLPKGCFPRLLTLLMGQIKINAENNLRAGFRKTGRSVSHENMESYAETDVETAIKKKRQQESQTKNISFKCKGVGKKTKKQSYKKENKSPSPVAHCSKAFESTILDDKKCSNHDNND
ncbi:hypothetical protein ACJJTC_014035 [Scirpophaga incertulas]